MAIWSALKSWAVGDTLTSTDMNKYVGANGNLHNLYDRISALEADAQVADRCIVSHSANQILPDGFHQPLSFNSETLDVVSGVSQPMHDTVTGNTRIYCRKAGVYYVWGSAEFSTIQVNERMLSIKANGSIVVAKTHKLWNPSSYDLPFTLQVSCLLKLANADYVELLAMKNSGPANTVYVNAVSFYSPIFGMIRWPGT